MKIISSTHSIVSCRKLRDALVRRGFPRYPVTSRPSPDEHCLFRYGNTRPVEQEGLNTLQFVQTVSMKQRLARLVAESNTPILTPQYSHELGDVTYPIVVRETLSSYGGKGIHIARSEAELQQVWQPWYWWTPFVETTREWRILCCAGEIYRAFEKTSLNPDAEPIRNGHRGWHFSIRNPEKFERLSAWVSDILHPLLRSIGGTFYGLDVGLLPNREFFLFEVNSAPGLNDNSATSLAERLEEIL